MKNEKVIEIPIKPSHTRAGSRKPPVEILAELYSCYTAKEIAQMYGVREATVRSWIARERRRYEKFVSAQQA